MILEQYTSDAKVQSEQWTGSGNLALKKTILSAEKVVKSVFLGYSWSCVSQP